MSTTRTVALVAAVISPTLGIITALLILDADPLATVGGSCEADWECERGLRCTAGTCATQETFERSLLVQSGVEPKPSMTVERRTLAGSPVRVRETRGETPVFAACASNERLIGGGCSGGDKCLGSCSYLRSYPGNFTPDDTIGARWHCTGGVGELRAYALCQVGEPRGAWPFGHTADRGQAIP